MELSNVYRLLLSLLLFPSLDYTSDVKRKQKIKEEDYESDEPTIQELSMEVQRENEKETEERRDPKMSFNKIYIQN